MHACERCSKHLEVHCDGSTDGVVVYEGEGGGSTDGVVVYEGEGGGRCSF